MMQASRVLRFAATRTPHMASAVHTAILRPDGAWKIAAEQRKPQQLMKLLGDLSNPVGQRVGRTWNKDPTRITAAYTVTKIKAKSLTSGKVWGTKDSKFDLVEKEIRGPKKKEWVLLGEKKNGDSRDYAATFATELPAADDATASPPAAVDTEATPPAADDATAATDDAPATPSA